MSDQADGSGSNGTMQFEKAEFEGAAAAGLHCALCHQSIGGTYFDVNGKPVCTVCETSLKNSIESGFAPARLVKATLFGAGAGLAGAIIYFAVLALTGYEFGLISILVGWMVGGAVRKGAEYRGGLVYQVLACAITYIAIVSTYVPYALMSMKDDAGTPASAAEGVAAESMTSVDTGTTSLDTRVAAPVAATASPSATSEHAASPKAPAPSLGSMLLALLQISALILALPFLAGIENVIGLLIIGFALWQAWSMNRKVKFVISGPFQAGATNPAAGT